MSTNGRTHSISNFFHLPGLEEHALTMKALGDAIQVRNRLGQPSKGREHND